ncbi:purine-nucleoside phosphorylase [Clostridium botulinum]|uniref:Purine nucleoside phosphorylase n=1 Tax=Clostridium botulinum C/D str. DC5 TaxID=1443128 RepID=A0A0A0IKE3_CLOBO|nr:purine-nucleoside phosphorylase [Clostridium botulinum]KEI07532.1 purine nucleoside phosphorylase [Clostridium botulinum C/D str. BKT75002]KEI09900.1 purine nucleoside phosphorylase [Clostridium botulinum C/D str. BKT2873]KGM95645.1 purine nucleoside phosphorylase [Clostridium botulinum D str. CCUG 7971]KGN00036.1 purine nucleoside phosphorylase [Clostridium botulinum C/D str. DC5]KOC46871.1 purine nucleoside phosphorylase [Clostridium botulinum]
MDLYNQIQEAAKYIQEKSKYTPEIGLILGSGLGAIGDKIENAEYYPYSEIPHFPVSTVEGHAGRLVIGTLQGRTVIAMQGRFHFYEGYKMQEVTFPVRVMKLLGISKLIVTNAAGAVNTNYKPGDLMLISDHLNLMGDNPLMGRNLDQFGARFPDMSNAYDKELRGKVKEIASSLGVELQEGVYAAMSGPTYETPAEIRMIRTLGGDAAGMSTVPEVIIASHSGIKTVGISCMTNMAAGILDQPLDHEEVIETSERVRETFIKLMNGVIKEI